MGGTVTSLRRLFVLLVVVSRVLPVDGAPCADLESCTVVNGLNEFTGCTISGLDCDFSWTTSLDLRMTNIQWTGGQIGITSYSNFNLVAEDCTFTNLNHVFWMPASATVSSISFTLRRVTASTTSGSAFSITGAIVSATDVTYSSESSTITVSTSNPTVGIGAVISTASLTALRVRLSSVHDTLSASVFTNTAVLGVIMTDAAGALSVTDSVMEADGSALSASATTSMSSVAGGIISAGTTTVNTVRMYAIRSAVTASANGDRGVAIGIAGEKGLTATNVNSTCVGGNVTTTTTTRSTAASGFITFEGPMSCTDVRIELSNCVASATATNDLVSASGFLVRGGTGSCTRCSTSVADSSVAATSTTNALANSGGIMSFNSHLTLNGCRLSATRSTLSSSSSLHSSVALGFDGRLSLQSTNDRLYLEDSTVTAVAGQGDVVAAGWYSRTGAVSVANGNATAVRSTVTSNANPSAISCAMGLSTFESGVTATDVTLQAVQSSILAQTTNEWTVALGILGKTVVHITRVSFVATNSNVTAKSLTANVGVSGGVFSSTMGATVVDCTTIVTGSRIIAEPSQSQSFALSVVANAAATLRRGAVTITDSIVSATCTGPQCVSGGVFSIGGAALIEDTTITVLRSTVEAVSSSAYVVSLGILSANGPTTATRSHFSVTSSTIRATTTDQYAVAAASAASADTGGAATLTSTDLRITVVTSTVTALASSQFAAAVSVGSFGGTSSNRLSISCSESTISARASMRSATAGVATWNGASNSDATNLTAVRCNTTATATTGGFAVCCSWLACPGNLRVGLANVTVVGGRVIAEATDEPALSVAFGAYRLSANGAGDRPATTVRNAALHVCTSTITSRDNTMSVVARSAFDANRNVVAERFSFAILRSTLAMTNTGASSACIMTSPNGTVASAIRRVVLDCGSQVGFNSVLRTPTWFVVSQITSFATGNEVGASVFPTAMQSTSRGPYLAIAASDLAPCPTNWAQERCRQCTESASTSPTFSDDGSSSLSQTSQYTASASLSLSWSLSTTSDPTASGSLTSEATRSESASFSISQSPSAESSQSTSVNDEGTKSVSATSDVTVSRSSTATVSISVSLSVTISASSSVSLSLTHSPSSSSTRSVQPTPSRTLIMTSTATIVPTTSASDTLSLSTSNTASHSESTTLLLTQSPSLTPSSSQSASASASASQSRSESVSKTESRSGSVSTSESLTPSVSATFTWSETSSRSGTQSESTSGTISVSASRSGSLSASASKTSSRTASLPPTPTRTLSPSVTRSLGSTPSFSATVTPSLPPTKSLTASLYCSVSFTEIDFQPRAIDMYEFREVIGGVVEINITLQQDSSVPPEHRLVFSSSSAWNAFDRQQILREINCSWGVVTSIRSEPPNRAVLRLERDPSMPISEILITKRAVAVIKLPIRGTRLFTCHNVLTAIDGTDVETRRSIDFEFVPSVIPVPPQTRRTAEYVALGSTMVSGVLSNPSAAMVQARSSALMALSVCRFSLSDPLEPTDSPFGWTVGQKKGGYYRGALVGAFFLLIVCVAFGGFVAFLFYNPSRVDRGLWGAMAVVHLPGALIVPISQFMQSSVMVATALIGHGPGPFDFGLGLGCYIVTVVIVGLVTWRTTRGFYAIVVPRQEAQDPNLSFLKSLGYRLFLSTQKWIDDPERPQLSEGFKSHWHPLFNDFRHGRQWFLSLELSISVFVGVLAGLQREDLCDEIAMTFLVLIGAQFAMALFLRPFIALFETFFHILLSSLTFLSSLLLVIGDYRNLDNLRTASAFVALVTVFLSTFKSILDIISLGRWFHSRYVNHRRKARIRRMSQMAKHTTLAEDLAYLQPTTAAAASATKLARSANGNDDDDENTSSVLESAFRLVDNVRMRLRCSRRPASTIVTKSFDDFDSSSSSDEMQTYEPPELVPPSPAEQSAQHAITISEADVKTDASAARPISPPRRASANRHALGRGPPPPKVVAEVRKKQVQCLTRALEILKRDTTVRTHAFIASSNAEFAELDRLIQSPQSPASPSSAMSTTSQDALRSFVPPPLTSGRARALVPTGNFVQQERLAQIVLEVCRQRQVKSVPFTL